MRDCDIRKALVALLERQHQNDDSLILHELGLCEGEGRADIGVVNGKLTGYEIKSDKDTLDRLPGQTHTYNRCFDRIVLVVTAKHLDEAIQQVPDWWGIWLATILKNGNVALQRRRAAKANPAVDVNAVIQLLWRDEALQLCKRYGISEGLGRKTRRELWSALSAELPKRALLSEVRATLKARGDWRAAPPLFRRGENQPTEPTADRRQHSIDWLLSLSTPNHPR